MLATVESPITTERMDEVKRRELAAVVVKFLRDPAPRAMFREDDAAATSSAGYSLGIDLGVETDWNIERDGQPPGYDAWVRRGAIGQGRISQYAVQPDDGPSPHESQRFEDDVARVCDSAMARWESRWKILHRTIPQALALLEHRDKVQGTHDREILYWAGEKYMTFRHIGQILGGMASSTVFDRYQAALSWVVDQVFDEHGAVRMG